MDTKNDPASDDQRPEDQKARAAAAHLNPNDPAKDEGSPAYGEFGGKSPTPSAANPAAQPANGRSGANENPDEFSELDSREREAQKAPATAAGQSGHIEQNQDPAAVRAAHNEGNDEQRAAWAKDDPRYAGGGTHNTREEPAGNPATDE